MEGSSALRRQDGKAGPDQKLSRAHFLTSSLYEITLVKEGAFPASSALPRDDLLRLLLKGFLLGWSVAWPPGPINAEMLRRALTRGFWQAYSISLGACTGDFLWALGVALGAGAVADIPGVRAGLGVVSTGLLLALAWVYLRGAWASYRALKSGAPKPPERALDSARRGYALGLMMALTSPWNIAFWLAVVGQGALAEGAVGQGALGERFGVGRSIVMALAVVGGAGGWGLTLCAAVRLGARFATPRWDITTRAATGALMLAFAARSIGRLLGL